MTHKITHVTPGETWTGRDGQTNYDLNVTLNDGRTATVTAKSPDRWKAGDEVIIKSERPGRYGMKWSLDKAGYGQHDASAQAPTGQKTTSENTLQIEAGWAIAALLASGNPPKTEEAMLKEAAELVRVKRILADQLANLDHKQPTQTQDDDVPY